MFSKYYDNKNYWILLNDTKIKFVSSMKDLGVIFNRDCTFDEYIDYIVIEASRKLNYLKYTCSKFETIKPLVCIYNSTV